MAIALDVRLLGPVEIWYDSRRIGIGDPKQRCVLAVLAAEANRPVGTGILIDRVWGDRAPSSARNALYNYIAGIRNTLGGLASAVDRIRLGRASGGYLLEVDPNLVDLHRFRDLTERARRAARTTGPGREDEAAELWSRALRAWRGTPFQDLRSPWLDELRETLERQRFAAVLERNESELAGGRHAQLLTELSDLADIHPLDERVAEQLMLALYRCGRPAEALRAYQRILRCLATELGVDPGPALLSLQQRILRNDPGLALSEPRDATRRPGSPPADPAATAEPPPAATTPTATAAAATAEPPPAPGTEVPTRPDPPVRPVPAQLPHDLRGFTAREPELAALRELAESGCGGTVVICAVDGAAGVGKTALAVHFGHEAAGRFPDGQLYVNLRGFHPDQEPLTPGEALSQFLRSFGVEPARIPAELAEQAALYRSLLAGKRMLVVLDNAVTAEQVRPMLPGAGTSMVLVTSRNRLAGLGVRDGAHRITLDVLEPAQAVALLAGTIGVDRVLAEHPTAVELSRLCGHLPLALRIAAEQIAAHPELSLADLVGELTVERDRLDLLAAEDDQVATVRAVFSWSYRALKPATARAFRLLGLHPGTEISTPAAAALVGTDESRARRLTGELANAHLLQPIGVHRYRFHDLLRVYAVECATTDETAADRDAARNRLLTWYLYTADAAGRVLNPHRRRTHTVPADPDCPPVRFSARAEALAWCEAERSNLREAVRQAVDGGLDAIAWQLPMALWDFFYLRKHWPDWLATHRLGLAAARRCADPAGEAWLLTSLGNAHWELGQFTEALEASEQALDGWRRLGDRWGEGIALHLLGGAHMGLRQYLAGIDHYRRALAMHRQADNQWGLGWTLASLGAAYRELGRHDEALDASQQARAVWHELGDRHGEGITLNNLGNAYRKLGRFAEAIDCHQQALDAHRETGNRWGEAWTLASLGKALHATGRDAAGQEAWRQALKIFDDLGHDQAVELRAWLARPATAR